MSFDAGDNEVDDEIPLDAGFYMANSLVDCVKVEDADTFPEDPLGDYQLITLPERLETQATIKQEEPPPPPAVLIPSTVVCSQPAYRNWNQKEFTEEMEQSIRDIVQESLSLFQKDPREYHPFYLRIYKYLVIGQQLGYISNDNSVEEIWRKYDNYAKTQLELSKQTSSVSPMVHEQSAYATYILTKKVIINGKVVKTEEQNKKEMQKMYRRLDKVVKTIKSEWKGSIGNSIREDLKPRLKFFKECQAITYPSTCIKMNNLWTKLLLEDVPAKTETNSDVVAEKLVKRKVSNESKKGFLKILVASPPPSSPAPAPPVKNVPVVEGDAKEKTELIKNEHFALNQKRLTLFRNRKKFKKTEVNSKSLLLIKKLKLKISSLNKKSKMPALYQFNLEKVLAKKLPLPINTPIASTSAKTKKGTQGNKLKVANTTSQKTTVKRNVIKIKSGRKPKKTSMEGSSLSENKSQQETVSDAQTEAVNGNSKKRRKSESCVCDECGAVLSHPRGLVVHKYRIHRTNRRVFHCPAPLCKKGELKDAKSLWMHYVQAHMNAEDLFPELAKLDPRGTRKMTRRDSSIPSGAGGACEHCGKTFAPLSNLLRHIKNAHGEGLRKENYVKCPYCEKEFKERNTMQAHVRRLHELTEVIRCDVCGKGYGSTGRLWKHKVDDHGLSPEVEAAAAGIKYEPCQFCGEQLLVGRQAKNHVQNQHPENFEAWWLVVQERRKQAKLELKREQRRKLKEGGDVPEWLAKEKARKGDRYCPKCQMNIRGTLIKHLEMQHNIQADELDTTESLDVNLGEMWECPRQDCDAKFAERRNLVLHLTEVHCDLEERIVAENLVKFVEKVDRYYKYLCTLCSADLYDRGEVRVHLIAQHPDVVNCIKLGVPIQPEHSCPHCPCKFKEDQELRNHVETCHLDLCWRCPECLKVMLSPDDLTVHFTQNHSGTGSAAGKPQSTSNVKTGDASHSRLPGILKRNSHLFAAKYGRKKIKLENPVEQEKARRAVYMKYQAMRSNCLICNKLVGFGAMSAHLKNVHDITENGTLWICRICGKDTFTKRDTWLSHMELGHQELVDMQQLIETAKRINTLEDWRTMDIKTLHNKRGRKSKQEKADKSPKMKMASEHKKSARTIRNNDNHTRKLSKITIKRKQRRNQKTDLGKLQAIAIVEKEKRLVIPVHRLAPDEIFNWTRKNGQTT